MVRRTRILKPDPPDPVPESVQEFRRSKIPEFEHLLARWTERSQHARSPQARDLYAELSRFAAGHLAWLERVSGDM